MKNFNIICLLAACALVLMAISCVNAADVNDTAVIVHDNTTLPVNDYVDAPVNDQTPMDVEKSTPTEVTVANKNTNLNDNQADSHGSMTELKNQLKFVKSGSTYTFNKDYQFLYGKDIIHAIVIMANNVVIDGNGHVIDGKNYMDHFYISGNNVTIKNLTIIHFKNKNNSPIVWNGNEGILSNCTLNENSGIMGGAIQWNGKNGLIRSSNFKDNIAQKIAGAIYINGENMKVTDTTFLNCTSKIVGEAVYVSSGVKRWGVSGNFNNAVGIVDGGKTNINLNVLSKTYETSLNNKNIDLVPLLYNALITGKANYLESDIIFYGRYVNNNTYELVIHRIFPNGIIYEKHFTIQNVQNPNDICNKLIAKQGHMSQMLIKNVDIAETGQYNSAVAIKSNVLNNVLNSIPASERAAVVKALNVNFKQALTITSKATWNPVSSGFDVININGHHSKITWKSASDDENKFATLKNSKIISISDLTIDGFNTALENFGGTFYLNGITLSNNKMDYLIERDWGAAIINTGEVFCNNCTFINNYAKNGGAIFNQGRLEITNCGFHDNYAYNEGDNICNGKGGVVIVNGKDCSDGIGIVHKAESFSATESKVVSIGGAILSIGAGIAAGIITANPVAGFAVGLAVGAGIGALSAGIIIEHKFDVNYDRATLAATLIISDALSGAFGGCAAGSMRLAMTSATYEGVNPGVHMFGEVLGIVAKITECNLNHEESGYK